jgi:hypothetical protein
MEIEHPFADPAHPRHREFTVRFARAAAATDVMPDEERPERLRRPPSLVQLIAQMEREIPEPAPVIEPEPEISFTRTRSR